MSEDFRPFIDKFGLIAQKDTSGADGGDSTHRFGVMMVCLKLLKMKYWVTNDRVLDDYYSFAMNQYEDGFGSNTYRRHPDPDKWYSNPLNFSRDQTAMLLNAMLIMNDKRRIDGLAKELIKRGGLHKNAYPNYAYPNTPEYKRKFPDIATPNQLAAILRSFRSKFLYPIICVLDLFKLGDVVLARRDDEESKKKGKRTDYYTMLLTDLIVARATQDTFVARLAAKLLKKDDYMGAISWVFGSQFDDPPIHKLLKPLADKYIESL